MINLLLFCLVLALTVVFCGRHFIIYIVGTKLFLDVIVLLMARANYGVEGSEVEGEAMSWVIASISALICFSIIVVATRKFASRDTLNLEAKDE